MAINTAINDSATFQLPLEKFKPSLNEQFSSFKELFIAEVLQLKNNLLQKKAMQTDGSTTEKLFHQMAREVSFLHDKLKIKNSVINFLLETLIKYKDEKTNTK